MKKLPWFYFSSPVLILFTSVVLAGLTRPSIAAENIPPKCKIAEPPPGQVFTNPERINIWALPSDQDGFVVSVEMFADGQSLGEIAPNHASASAVNPFHWIWANPPAGDHKLSALAKDNEGGQSSSNPIVITVKRDPPPPRATLETQKPMNGDVFTAPATVEIQVVAVDPNGDIRHVEFFANDQFIGASDHLTKEAVIPGRPITHFLEWQNVAAGEYKIIARAKDTLGNPVESDAVGIIVKALTDDLPVVSIEATWAETSEPIPGALMIPGRLVISRTGPLDQGLNVFLDYSGTATWGVDYEDLPAWIEIKAGQKSAELLVMAKTDNVVEDTETVVTSILPPQKPTAPILVRAYKIDPDHASGTVKIRDVPPSDGGLPVVSIEATVPETSEPSPTVRIRPGAFTLSRTGDASQPLKVLLRIEGTATPDADYTRIENVAEFPAGSAQIDILVQAIDDDLVEGDETVALILTQSPTANVPTYSIDPNKNAAKVLIHDSDKAALATLQITVPKEGARFNLGDPITINATAIDPNGYISRVEFYDRDTLIGVSQITFIRAPDPGTPIGHTFEWNGATAGEHVLTARAGDSSNNKVISNRVVIYVDGPPQPSIVINAPKYGEAFKLGDVIKIDATAVDPNGYIPKVEFYDGDQLIGASIIDFIVAPPPGTPIQHTFEWKDASVGEHVLTARGATANGNAVVSQKVLIKVYQDVIATTIVRIVTIDAEATEFPPEVDAINPAQFEISRDGGDMSRDLLVYFSWHGTASWEKDYHGTLQPVMIPAGQKSATVGVTPISDDETEPMETVAVRLEGSPDASPIPQYEIDPRYGEAAAVIYDRSPPKGGAVELALPDNGETYPANQIIPLIAEAYHPTANLDILDFYADGNLIGTSQLEMTPPDSGGLRIHRFDWKDAAPGQHTITAQAVLADGTELSSSKVLITVGEGTSLPIVSVKFVPDNTERPWPNADFAPGWVVFNRTGDASKSLDVFYKVGGTATPGEDYESLPGQISFPEGKSEVSLQVNAIDDTLAEGNETVEVHLAAAPDYSVDPKSDSATVTIIDNDSDGRPVVSVKFLPDERKLPLPAADYAPGWFQFSRAGVTTEPLMVFFKVGGTATPGEDYQPLKGGVIIPAGESQVTIHVEAIDDKLVEGEETVVVHLIPPPATTDPSVRSDYIIDPEHAEATVIILDDDGPADRVVLEIAATDPVASELDANGAPDVAVFQIKRVAGPDVETTVYLKIEGTAQNGIDYSEIPERVVLPLGKQSVEVVVKPIPDKALEGDETVLIALQPPPCIAIANPPPSCYLIGPNGSARAVIKDFGGTGNNPPSVAIVRPESGSVFVAGDTIEIAAVAKDSDGTIERLDIFAGDKLLGSTKLGELAVKWPDVPAGQYVLTARALDNAGAEVTSAPVKILVRRIEEIIFVRRELPPSYVPGEAFTVKLHAEPPSTTSAYAVEDVPPTGWKVSDISNDGAFDATTGKVKFGPFTDHEGRVLTYSLTPPSDATGRVEFHGLSSINGNSSPIGGDRIMAPAAPIHPADDNPEDKSLALVELTAYAAAWKQGQTWPSGPNPIPLTYVTRAGYLWKNGEAYLYDPTKGAPPLCWIPAATPVRSLNVIDAPAAAAIREISWSDPANSINVKITVNPGTATAFALEESLPQGWAAADVSGDGTYDAQNGAIRWGLFFETTPQVLTYKLIPSTDSIKSITALRGYASFDGAQQLINGANAPEAKGTIPPRFSNIEHREDGGIELHLTGSPDDVIIIESSTDLLHWTEVKPVFLPDGQVSYVHENAAGEPQRFYRVHTP
jgi:hypothetical protein